MVRDVGRVLDLPYAMCDSIAKMIPNDLGMTLDKAIAANPDLRKLYNEDAQVKYLIDMSKRLEGLPRHTSMHAAGVVIGSRSIDEFVPLSKAADGTITTQFTMTTIEELGLLKMDFLGLRTLTGSRMPCIWLRRITAFPLILTILILMIKSAFQIHRNRKDRGRVPAGKRRDEELYEGA